MKYSNGEILGNLAYQPNTALPSWHDIILCLMPCRYLAHTSDIVSVIFSAVIPYNLWGHPALSFNLQAAIVGLRIITISNSEYRSEKIL